MGQMTAKQIDAIVICNFSIIIYVLEMHYINRLLMGFFSTR